MSTILIIGAKSDIAKALAREYAKHDYDLLLTGRNIEALKPFGDDLRIRYNRKAYFAELDVLDYASHQAFYDSLEEKPEGVIIAAGYLGDQKLAENDFDEAHKILDTNYTGAVSILNIIATDFEERKSGFIIGISSIAGDRGRGSNYFYGSAKAGFSAYLSGLRNRLFPSNVQVLTVKPGFVDTKMTRGMDLPGALTAQPEEVAADIFKAQQKGKDVIYTKWMWRYISLIIRSIPEGIFKKLSL
jgi:short-subunit dehydrogenase